jgi:hypothetical protein
MSGFEIKQTPRFMQKHKSLPQRFKDRYYVVNTVQDNNDGSHSRAIHSVLKTSKIEKGVLILTVALIFCKGENHSDGSRHILARELYRLMHAVDENIPEDPTAQGTARAKAGTSRHSKLQGDGTSCTPNFDVMLKHFVQADYLVKEKATEENFHSSPIEEGDVLYSMGHWAALELGRKQIITFCAEILNEEPDPSVRFCIVRFDIVHFGIVHFGIVHFGIVQEVVYHHVRPSRNASPNPLCLLRYHIR